MVENLDNCKQCAKLKSELAAANRFLANETLVRENDQLRARVAELEQAASAKQAAGIQPETLNAALHQTAT